MRRGASLHQWPNGVFLAYWEGDRREEGHQSSAGPTGTSPVTLYRCPCGVIGLEPTCPACDPLAPMPTAVIRQDPHLDTLHAAGLLCAVCQLQPWTQQAQYVTACICAACAEGEPDPEED